jgi:hypothetical protein
VGFTKTTIVDRLAVLEHGQLEVRTATVVAEDGVELTRTFRRRGFDPGDDVTDQSQRVQDVAAATWTADILTAWAASEAAKAADEAALLDR